MIGPMLNQVAREAAKNPTLRRIAAEVLVRTGIAALTSFAINEGGKAALDKWRKRRRTGRRKSSRNRR